MNNPHKTTSRKVLSILLGIAFALLMSAPYLLFKEQLQQMTLVGYLSVAIGCAISNSSILLPSSSTLIVVAAASSLNPVLCILAGGLGTALGEQSSYLCGRIGGKGFDPGPSCLQVAGKEKRILKYLKRHDALTVFVFAFLPLPIFDLVGIAAGGLRMNWFKYLIAAALGKTFKFFLAVLSVYYLLPFLLPYLNGPGRMILETFLAQFGAIHQEVACV